MNQKVFPTKSNLINTKKSLDQAKLGFELLDRKRNILVREMMQMIDRAKTIRTDIKRVYSEAYLSLQNANIMLGYSNINSEAVPIDNSLTIDFRSVMGVELPVVKIGESEKRPYYGLSTTSSYLDDAYIRFEEVKKLTVELAQLESNVCRLAEAMKKTQKRANALKNIVIPQLEATAKYITEALDEKEREEFSRLKVVKKQST